MSDSSRCPCGLGATRLLSDASASLDVSVKDQSFYTSVLHLCLIFTFKVTLKYPGLQQKIKRPTSAWTVKMNLVFFHTECDKPVKSENRWDVQYVCALLIKVRSNQLFGLKIEMHLNAV